MFGPETIEMACFDGTAVLPHYAEDTTPKQKATVEILKFLGGHQSILSDTEKTVLNGLDVSYLECEVRNFLANRGLTLEFKMLESIVKGNFGKVLRRIDVKLSIDKEIENYTKVVLTPRVKRSFSMKKTLLALKKSHERTRNLLTKSANNFIITPRFS